MTDLRLLSVREAARRIAERRLSAEALTAAYLDHIEAREAVIGAWQYLDREAALAVARQRDAEPPRQSCSARRSRPNSPPSPPARPPTRAIPHTPRAVHRAARRRRSPTTWP